MPLPFKQGLASTLYTHTPRKTSFSIIPSCLCAFDTLYKEISPSKRLLIRLFISFSMHWVCLSFYLCYFLEFGA